MRIIFERGEFSPHTRGLRRERSVADVGADVFPAHAGIARHYALSLTPRPIIA